MPCYVGDLKEALIQRTSHIQEPQQEDPMHIDLRLRLSGEVVFLAREFGSIRASSLFGLCRTGTC